MLCCVQVCLTISDQQIAMLTMLVDDIDRMLTMIKQSKSGALGSPAMDACDHTPSEHFHGTQAPVLEVLDEGSPLRESRQSWMQYALSVMGVDDSVSGIEFAQLLGSHRAACSMR